MAGRQLMSFKNKLLATVIPPVVGLLALGAVQLLQEYQRSATLTTLEQLLSMTASANDLVSQLQVERGLSAAVLKGAGQQFVADLREARSETDAAARRYRKLVSRVDEGNDRAGLGAINRRIRAKLEELGSMRERIDGGALASGQMAQFYTGVIGRLLEVAAKVPNAMADSRIAAQTISNLAAFYALQQHKEYGGRERAAVAEMLASGTLTEEQSRQLKGLVGEQDAYFDSFKRLASSRFLREYESRVKGMEVVQAERIRKLAVNGEREALLKVSSQRWWDAQSAKLANISKVSESMRQGLSSAAKERAAASSQSLWVHGLVIGLLALAVIGSVAFIIRSLGQSLGHLQNATEAIRSSCGEIATGNKQLSERTEKQAANLEESSSAMEELASTVKSTATNANEMDSMGSETQRKAEEGGQVVQRAIEAMEGINESSNEIAKIVNVIDDIAFQTNLLALNASVEAARAGEHGRGFAVVATEVRNLAQRSASSAKEIKELIESASGKVEEGRELVNRSGEMLREIIQQVQQLNERTSHIANGTSEQSTGIAQTNQAVSEMDQVTQQNAALAEEVAAASESANDAVEQLTRVVAFFNSGSLISVASARQPPALASSSSHSGAKAKGITRESGSDSEARLPQNTGQRGANADTRESQGGVERNGGEDDSEWQEF